MVKLREWLESRLRKPAARYDETKKEFEKIMGRPAITITVELPENFEDFRKEFLRLEKDEEFVNAVKKLVENYLEEEQREQVDTSETS